MLGIRHAKSSKVQGTVKVRKFKKVQNLSSSPYLQPSQGSSSPDRETRGGRAAATRQPRQRQSSTASEPRRPRLLASPGEKDESAGLNIRSASMIDTSYFYFGLVLGWIDADLCRQTIIFKHLSRSPKQYIKYVQLNLKKCEHSTKFCESPRITEILGNLRNCCKLVFQLVL